MANVEVNLKGKTYTVDGDVHNRHMMTAYFGTINKNDRTVETLVVRDSTHPRDFIEEVVDKAVCGESAVKSLRVQTENFTVDSAMKEYLQDKYPKITFK